MLPQILISLLLLMTLGLRGCREPVPEIIEEDGGVTQNTIENVSEKVIKSDKITSFECELSLITFLEEDSEFSGRVYTLSAEVKNDTVFCKTNWHDRYGNSDKQTFTADASLMTKLQDIVTKYDFAMNNGHVYKVSGLGEMYGAVVDIKYASGEYIYASDNENCFIPLDAVHEIINLFDYKEKE